MLAVGLEKTTRTSKADLAAPDWWWLHSLRPTRMGPCSQTGTFPANKIGATGFHHPGVLMMMTMMTSITRINYTCIAQRGRSPTGTPRRLQDCWSELVYQQSLFRGVLYADYVEQDVQRARGWLLSLNTASYKSHDEFTLADDVQECVVGYKISDTGAWHSTRQVT